MLHRLFLGSILVLLLLAASTRVYAADSEFACPVTRPQFPPFVPAPPYPPNAGWGRFWYGTDALWVGLNFDGTWNGGGEKLFLWKKGFDWRKEPTPEIIVTEKRLDVDSKPLVFKYGTHAIMGSIASMLTSTSIMAPGCWEITAQHGADRVAFVVAVRPQRV
jgi:hypothetical protein